MYELRLTEEQINFFENLVAEQIIHTADKTEIKDLEDLLEKLAHAQLV